MSTQSPQKPENGRFRRHRPRKTKAQGPAQGEQRQERKAAAPAVPPKPPQTCKICGKPIFDLAGAFSAPGEGGEPIHFDCAIELIARDEVLKPDEKIVYIGQGNFAVIAQLPGGKFAIRKKIPWELQGTVPAWRREMMLSPDIPGK